MTTRLLKHTNKKFSSKIKYTDLAIAVALSSASLFLIPGVSKAATTTDSTTSPTSSTEVATTGSSTTSPTTTATSSGGTATTTGGSSSTSSTGTSTPTTTGTSTGATSPTAGSTAATLANTTTGTTATTGTPTTGTNVTSPSNTAGSTVSSSTSTSSSTIDLSSFTVPASGYAITDTPSTSTTTPATYSVSVQAYGTDGNPLGSAIPVTTTQAANSTYNLSWTPDLLTQLSSSIPNSANYTAWTPASLTSSLAVPITDSNVCVKVYYALKNVTATYTYVDESTGTTLYTQTDTYDFSDPTNNAIFKAEGIKPADATLSNETHFLTADDTSTAAQTDPTQLPYFGPTGMIFNNTSYVLDSAKSDGITPLSYTYWPQSNISKTFYYTEATKPTISISAVDSLGNTIKTFDSNLSPTATLPSETATGATYLPTATAATIPGYTITGFKAYASDSLSGAAPTELDGTFTPEQYESFLTSPANTLPYDTRALGDYQKLAIDFTYQGDPVTLMIQPVDADGDPIGSPISVGSGFVGESLTLNNPQVAGYSPESSTSTISIAPGQTTIPVTYSAVSEPTTTTDNSSKVADTTNPSTSTTTTVPSTGANSSSSTTTATGTGANSSSSTTTATGTGANSASSATTATSPTEQTGQTGSATATTSSTAPEGSTSAKTISTSEKALSSATIALNPAAAAKSVTSPTKATSYSSPTTVQAQAEKSNTVAAKVSPTAASVSPTSLSYSPTSAPIKTSNTASAASQLSSSPATTSKLPQTGNKSISLLSAIGIILLGLVGLSVDKIKKVF